MSRMQQMRFQQQHHRRCAEAARLRGSHISADYHEKVGDDIRDELLSELIAVAVGWAVGLGVIATAAWAVSQAV